MGIKILLSNFKRNKIRYILLLICLSVSTGIMTASLSLIKAVQDGFESIERGYWGDSDIIVRIFSDNETVKKEKNDKLLEYEIYSWELQIEYDYEKMVLRFFDIEDLDKINVIKAEDNENLRDGILVGQQFLDDKHLNIGDTIRIKNGLDEMALKITGEFTGSRDFSSTALENCFFTVYDPIKYNGISGLQKEMMIKVKDNDDLDEIFMQYQNEYGVDNVQLAFDKEGFNNKFDGIFVMLNLVGITVCMMSVSVLYSIKKFLVMLETKQYAVIRGIGGRPRYILSLFLYEGIIIGVISSLFSVAIYRLFAGVILYFISDGKVTQKGTDFIVFFYVFILNVFIMEIVNICASKNLRKANLKNLLIGDGKIIHKNKLFKKKFWIIILIVNLIVMFLFSFKAETVLVVPFIIISILCIINLAPYFGKVILMILSRYIQKFNGCIGYLAVKNIQFNNNFIANVSMLTVSVSLALVINASMYSVSTSSELNLKNNLKYDIIITGDIDDAIYDDIIDEKEIVGGYKNTDLNNIKVLNSNITIYSVDFIYQEYDKYRDFGIDNSNYKKLLAGDKKIVLTNRLLDDLKMDIGDSINLEILGRNVCFEIVGSFDTSINNGNFAVASYIDISGYRSETYFKVSDKDNVNQVVNKVKNVLEKTKKDVYSKDEYIEILLSSSKHLYDIIYCLSIVPFIISLVISAANAVFTYTENKKSLFVLTSIGLSERKVKRLYFLEQYISGNVGTVMGVCFGVLLILQIKLYMLFSGNTMKIKPALLIIIIVFALVQFFLIIASKIISRGMFNKELISEVRN